MKIDTLAKSAEGTLFGPEMRDDPYPVYRQLRETDPVHWEESLKAWVLTRYTDVAHVLNAPNFSSNRVSVARQRFPQKELEPLFDTLGQLMLQRDEPEHKQLRALVHDAFVRTAVDQWEHVVQERVDTLLDATTQKGRFDFIWEFAVPLPLLIIAEIVGIPQEDRNIVKSWCDDFSVVAANFYANISETQLFQGLKSTLEFREYLTGKVEDLRRSPRRDLLTSLVQAEVDGQRIGLDDLLANALLLLNAGNETTTNLLGNGLAGLLKHPDQLQRLRENPSLIPNAIEEFLRYDSPVQFLGRVALDDATIGDKTIRKGDLVLVLLGAANRDPEKFPDPDRLDVTRPTIHHVAFGHGKHFCVGAQLARLEARVAFRSLLSRWNVIELESSNLSRRDNFNLRCYRELPLKVTG